MTIGHVLQSAINFIKFIRSKQRNSTYTLTIDENIISAKLEIYVLREQCIHVEGTIRKLLTIVPHRERKGKDIHDLLIFQKSGRCYFLKICQETVNLFFKVVHGLIDRDFRTQGIFNVSSPGRIKWIPAKDQIVLPWHICTMLVLIPNDPTTPELPKWKCCRKIRCVRMIGDDAEHRAVFLFHDRRANNAAPRNPFFDCSRLQSKFIE